MVAISKNAIRNNKINKTIESTIYQSGSGYKVPKVPMGIRIKPKYKTPKAKGNKYTGSTGESFGRQFKGTVAGVAAVGLKTAIAVPIRLITNTGGIIGRQIKRGYLKQQQKSALKAVRRNLGLRTERNFIGRRTETDNYKTFLAAQKKNITDTTEYEKEIKKIYADKTNSNNANKLEAIKMF